ncbi:MAG: queuosine precursor transporter [Candidatus Cyclobacteriaceae bacterium M2_1C_046]
MSTLDRKKQNVYIILCGIFITNAILAELIGVKIFSLEQTLGFDPVNLNVFGYTLDFNLTAGVLIWPVVFITTDIINEYFGKPGVKRISFITAGLIVYSFIIISMVINVTPAQFWLDINSTDSAGQPFNIDYAFNTVYGQGLGIIIGSITAFLIGQLLDVFIFHRLKRITGTKFIWLRATGSTLVSQLVDSFLVLTIAFYLFGNWTFLQVASVAIINYTYKFVIAIILTPLIYLGHYLIDRYLGKEYADSIAEQATRKSKSFI